MKKYWSFLGLLVFIFGLFLPLTAEKTETVEGVLLKESSADKKATQKVPGTFYTGTKRTTPEYSFADLQVLEPPDKLTTYKESLLVKGIVGPSIDLLKVGGSPVKIREQGIFYTTVHLEKFGKHLIEILGRTKSEEVVINKRVLYLASFKDIKAGQWAADTIEYLATLGYLVGDASENFKPSKEVSRSDFAEILARVNKIDLGAVKKIDLTDVPASSSAAPAIWAALEKGWLKISARSYFYPERPLSRAEFFDVLRKLEGLPEIKNLKISAFQDVSNHPYAGSIAALKKAGWFESLIKAKQAKFYPDVPITRRELAYWLAKLSPVTQEVIALLNWETGFAQKEELPLEEVVVPVEKQVVSPKEVEPQKDLKLTERRARQKPLEEKAAEPSTVSGPIAAGPRAAEKKLIEETLSPGLPKAKEILTAEKASGLKSEEKATPEISEPEIVKIAPERAIISQAIGKYISFDLKDAEISDVIKIFAQEMGINIIAGSDVTGKVNISFNKVSLQEAFETVLSIADCSYIIQGDVILVYSGAKLGGLLSRKTILQIYKIGYADINELTEKVNKLVSKFGETIIDKRLRLFIVRDLPENLEQIDKIIKELDAPPKQVLVEAMILEINLTSSKSIGVKWKLDPQIMPGMSEVSYLALPPHGYIATEGFAGEPGTTGEGFYVHILKEGIRAYMNALEATTDYDILASPRIVALNHEQASILAGSQMGYVSSKTTSQATGGTVTSETVTFFETGIKLIFTPHITEQGFILMEIHPEVSEGKIVSERLPEKTTTETTTKVLVKDGQTILLGGLIRDKNINTQTGVPILSSLPFIGTLFSKKEVVKEKREMIVLLTPYIINEKMLEKFSREKKEFEEKKTQRKTTGKAFKIF